MQEQLPLKFNACIFDKMEIPEDDQWIYDLKNKYDLKKKQEENQWIFDLIDKYNK